MEQNYTYIFQEINLLNQDQQRYVNKNNSQFITELHEQIFQPQIKLVDGQIIKEHDNRSITRFNNISLAEDYLCTIAAILGEYRNQKREFYIETTSYIWSSSNESLTGNEVRQLKRVSNLISQQSGVFCSQKLALTSFISDKIIEQDKSFYVVRLTKSKVEKKTKKPKNTALRTLIFIISLGASVISYKWLSSQFKSPVNNLHYKNLLQSMIDQEPAIINQKLRKLSNKNQTEELENLLLEYVKTEWKLFSRFPDSATSQPISQRILELCELFPWSGNLRFFKNLLNLTREFSGNKLPSRKIELIYKSTKDINIHKTLIFIEFCIKFNADPYFLITDLMRSNQNELESVKISFLKSCLMHNIIGKEPQLIKWINHLSNPEVIDGLENWLNNSDEILSKNSFMLLIELNEMTGIIAKEYIEKKLGRNQKPLQEIDASAKLINQSDREVLTIYYENLLIKLRRQDRQKEIAIRVKQVLKRLDLN